MNLCKVCQKPLPVLPPSQQRVYCSMECMGLDRRTLPTVKMCDVCGKNWTPANRYQAARNTTCSRECASKRMSMERKGILRKPPRMATCPHCGRDFRILNGRKTANYCSRSCRGKANVLHLLPHSANMKGRKRNDPRYGASNPAWKGGVTLKRPHGNYKGVRYVRCPQEYLPMARGDGYIMEHRLVMAQKIGRLLQREEVVHHIDHNPANNHPSNLELYPNNAAHKRAEGAASRSFLTVSGLP